MTEKLRIAIRLLGAGVLGLGVFWLIGDLHLTDAETGYHASALGQRWHAWHAPSLNLMQAIVERYVLPQLWTYVLLPLLLAPAWIVAAVFSTVLLALSVKKKGNRHVDQN